MDAINDSEEEFVTYESPYIHEENKKVLLNNGFHVVELVHEEENDIGISWTKQGKEKLYDTVINNRKRPTSQYDRKIGKTGPTGKQGIQGLRGGIGEIGATGDRGKTGEAGERGTSGLTSEGRRTWYEWRNRCEGLLVSKSI